MWKEEGFVSKQIMLEWANPTEGMGCSVGEFVCNDMGAGSRLCGCEGLRKVDGDEWEKTRAGEKRRESKN